MKPLLMPLKQFLVLSFVVSMFPTFASAQLFNPHMRYRIRSAFADKMLVLDVKGGPAAVGDGVQIQLYQWWKGGNQIWFIENQPDGTYVIRSSSSSLVLAVQGGPDAKGNGDRVQQSKFQGTANQKWRIQPVDPRTPRSAYKMISVGSNKVLDAVLDPGTNAVHDGTELQQLQSTGRSNQQWLIEPVI